MNVSGWACEIFCAFLILDGKCCNVWLKTVSLSAGIKNDVFFLRRRFERQTESAFWKAEKVSVIGSTKMTHKDGSQRRSKFHCGANFGIIGTGETSFVSDLAAFKQLTKAVLLAENAGCKMKARYILPGLHRFR